MVTHVPALRRPFRSPYEQIYRSMDGSDTCVFTPIKSANRLAISAPVAKIPSYNQWGTLASGNPGASTLFEFTDDNNDNTGLDWLDDSWVAIYPYSSAFYLGNTNTYGLANWVGNYITGLKVTYIGRPGKQLDSITILLGLDGAAGPQNVTVTCGLYLDSDKSFIAATEERILALTNVASWNTFHFSSPPQLTPNTAYILAGYQSNSAAGNTAEGITNAGSPLFYAVAKAPYNGIFPDPLVPGFNLNWTKSIYGNYSDVAPTVEYLAFDRRPTYLAVHADAAALLDYVNFRLPEGGRAYAGSFKVASVSRDTNSDGVPDFLETAANSRYSIPALLRKKDFARW